MHGSPLFRILFLSTALAVLGVVISAVSSSRHPSEKALATLPASPALSENLPTLLAFQFSAPVRHLTLTTSDLKTTLLDLPNPAPDLEVPVSLPLREDAFRGLLTVRWKTPGPNCFLQLTAQPEQLETRQLILHAPADLEQSGIELDWHQDELHDGHEH